MGGREQRSRSSAAARCRIPTLAKLPALSTPARRSRQRCAAPAGILLRTVDVETDATAVHALNETSFAANPDYRPQTFTSFVERHLSACDFDPRLSCVAEQSGVAMGFLLACMSPEEGLGFVDLLGVHPDCRRRGLATAMLTAAFAAFAAAGLREAQLGVASDNPHARRLYERCGMRPRFQFDSYERATPA